MGTKNRTRDTGRDIQTQTNYPTHTGIKNCTLLCGGIYKHKQIPQNVGAKNHTRDTGRDIQTQTNYPKNTGIKNHTPAMWWDIQT